MLKLITIDFWNTLFDSANGEHRERQREKVVMEQIEKQGKSVPPEKLGEALQAAWKFFNDEWLEKQRTPTTKELVHHFWAYLKMIPDDKVIQILEKSFAEGILEHPPELMPGVAEALPKLAKNYSLALISDTAFSPGTILQKLMEEKGILDYFSAFSFSDETGVSKPNEKAYMHVLEPLGAKPEEAIHIGDIERTDIAGAKSLGMKAILYKGDKNSPMRIHEEERTAADFTAESWDEIVEIINGL